MVATTRTSRRPAVALLVAAVLQVVAPVVTFLGPGSSPAQGGGDDLLISPAGWAFAIWGAVYSLALAQAVAALVGPHAVPRRLVVDLLGLYLAGTAWIAVSAVGSSLGTAAVLVAMAGFAIDGVLAARRADLAPTWFGRLTRVAVGLYAGWVTAALFVNLSTAAVSLGLGAREEGWQFVVLLLAAATVLAVVVASGGNPAYAGAATWAFVAIVATTVSSSATLLAVVAGAAALAVVATAAVTARQRGTRHRTT